MPDMRLNGKPGVDNISSYANEAQQKTNDRRDNAAVDLSSPIIYFGTSREVAPRQSGKEQHFVRAADEKSLAALTPMTKEAKLLTLFIAGIPPYFDNLSLEKLFKAVAKFQAWKQVFSGTGMAMPYGFVTYEEPDSLARALTILSSLRLPINRGSEEHTNFIITQDPMSKLYMDDYKALKNNAITDAKERNMLLSATGQAEKIIKDVNSTKSTNISERQEAKVAKVQKAAEDSNAPNAVTIMLSIEDELGDIPEEQRASIASEITSFRERSARRDQERARQIADLELKRLEYERASRSDVQKKAPGRGDDIVTLVRRERPKNDEAITERMSEQDIAARRQLTIDDEENRHYIKEENAWLAREGLRIASLKSDLSRVVDSKNHDRTERLYLLEKFEKFDDDKAAYRSSEEFYRDRVAWYRAREVTRRQELEQDAHEAQSDSQIPSNHSGQSDPTDFQTKDNASPAPVRLALSKAPEDIRRKPTAANEIMLEDDEQQVAKRVLVPMQFEEALSAFDRPEESSEALQKRLANIANSIPFSKPELWKYQVKWDLLDESTLNKLRIFIAKKIVDVLGVEEEDLTSAIMALIHARKGGQDIEQELDAAIGDAAESEVTAIKIWRFFILSLELKER
ncbi:Putative uncharacterized protein [Taphrina deformans PYCC 5710]|uniref:Uncharacterized protein n=1 Tax=Taphrina deformans (strain PYCC 5710 / ATCC 11124 / CBS 356.35 / IMI 108563 / JCM 9778 / NBRC 8474) TaxID=1097556 RepID=R4X6U2_TAPDE|nr:Putative uncharacterized protein [Taphrina deformans PYCC 5710]|eukprot:CCG80931.1 Putative uncharacterized protein [Taphrina deformans PYCC 5710]